MKTPSAFERIFKTKTNAFIDYLRAEQYDDAISVGNRHGLIEELVLPEIENAFETACGKARYNEAGKLRHILGAARARELAEKAYKKNIQRGYFRDADALAHHFGVPTPSPGQMKELISTTYRNAVSNHHFNDARQCVRPNLDILNDTNHVSVLELLLEAAALVVKNEPIRQWMPYLPGMPKFKCVPDVCKADCCRRTDWNVPLSRIEIQTIGSRTGIAERDFYDINASGSYGLKMVAEGKRCKCKFLGTDNLCQIQNFKPAACVKYPFTVFPFGRYSDGRLDWFPSNRTSDYLRDLPKARDAVCQLRNGNANVHFFVLLGYEPRKCPGFTNNPISMQEYLSLMGEQFDLYLKTDWHT